MLELYDSRIISMANRKLIQFYLCGLAVCVTLLFFTMGLGTHFYKFRPLRASTTATFSQETEVALPSHKSHNLYRAPSVQSSEVKTTELEETGETSVTDQKARTATSARHAASEVPGQDVSNKAETRDTENKNSPDTAAASERNDTKVAVPRESTRKPDTAAESKDGKSKSSPENSNKVMSPNSGGPPDISRKQSNNTRELKTTNPPRVSPQVLPPSPDKTSTSNSSSNASLPLNKNRGDTPDRGPRVLCHVLIGRLGNQLFQFASVLGLAYATNRIPVFIVPEQRHEIRLNDVFKHPVTYPARRQAELVERCNKAKRNKHEGPHCCRYNKNLTELDPAHDYNLGGYLQSWRYFKPVEGLVRQKMVFSDEIQKNVSEIVRDLRTKYKSYTLVGFHVRKGDITQNGNIALGYKSAGPGYINRSLEYFHSRFPDSVFVVSSDSIQWCRDNFPERYKLHFLEGNWSPVDLLVLASLDHIVTSFGTYSWWAGYWNRGITLYMDDFVVPGSPIGDQYNKTDYIYPGWVGL